MNDSIKHSDANGASVFRPSEAKDDYFVGKGNRRDVSQTNARPVRWPKNNNTEARRQFDVWHEVSMQILHRNGNDGGPFRTIGVFYKFVNWKTGTLWPLDITLAAQAGDCSEKTVSRDISSYRKLGIILVQKNVFIPSLKQKRRLITLAYPEPFPSGICIADDDDQLDTGGPVRPKQ